MNCEEARLNAHDFGRRRLEASAHDEVAAHLQQCEACAAVERSERVLDDVLAQRLPRYEAPDALKRRLAMIVGPEEVPTSGSPLGVAAPERPRRLAHLRSAHWARVLAPALAASLVLVSGIAIWRGTTMGARRDVLTSEVVNDHLRVLASQHPLDIESGGSHQVKPWFEGKLDFAPAVPTGEGAGLRLRGGAVGYVFDRKAAVVVYALRLHAVTLLVVPADGLPWPADAGSATAPSVRETSTRGFNVVWWRAGDLGYALVSDVNAAELAQVGAQLAGDATGRPAR